VHGEAIMPRRTPGDEKKSIGVGEKRIGESAYRRVGVGERRIGGRRLEFGVWRSAFGVWRLAFGRRSAPAHTVREESRTEGTEGVLAV